MRKEPKKIIYDASDTVPFSLWHYETNHLKKEKPILYLHGGGLVSGDAQDLPESYIDIFLDAGHDFIAIEYPLAPEATLEKIIAHTIKAVNFFLGINSHYSSYILFGRSAGAYLALQVANGISHKPNVLFLFYGYHTLVEASFNVPNRHYLQYAKITTRTIEQIKKSTHPYKVNKENRFALYVHYRQTGTWIKDILHPSEQPKTYSLVAEQLQKLPPAFVVASSGDPDVPFKISKKIATLIPNSHLETVDSKEHDFDRTPTPLALSIYNKMTAWEKQH